MIEYYNYKPPKILTGEKQLIVTIAYDKTEVEHLPPWEQCNFWQYAHQQIRWIIHEKSKMEDSLTLKP